jgi:hypothetical protein
VHQIKHGQTTIVHAPMKAALIITTLYVLTDIRKF